MFLSPSFSFVICVMVVTYVMLVGSISWIAWNQEDDGVRGLALFLCTNTISYVLLSAYGQLPELVVIGGYYLLTSLAITFLQYATLKFLRVKMHWWPYLVLLLLLVPIMAIYAGDIVAQTKIADVVFSFQYLIICISVLRRKNVIPSSGCNMFLAGVVLAVVITLWWLALTIKMPDRLYGGNGGSDSASTNLDLYFATYIVTLLITNGFILMTKERIQAELRNNTRKDDLTGLHTDSWINEDVQRHVEQLKQFALPTTLMLFDIDYFKEVNNQYSYATGNQIIRQLGDLLQQEIQVSHETYRIRGGKFAVIVPARNIYQIMDLAENVLNVIADHIFARESQISLSCGISVATTVDNWTSWLFRAQHALQKAKTYGRNQVQVDEIEFSGENLPTGIVRVGKLHWHPGFNTGHPEVDRQHREMFDQTNTLLQIWIRTDDKKLICEYVSELIAYAQKHYDYENQLMQPHEMEFSTRIQAHIARHVYLLERANDLFDRYRRNELTNDALLNFLVFEFVSVHIRDDDGQIAELIDLAPAETDQK